MTTLSFFVFLFFAGVDSYNRLPARSLFQGP